MSEVTFSSTLFVVRGRNRGRRFDLSAQKTTIGRHGTNDIQLHDTKASRRHAHIVFEGSGYKFVDLVSSNGSKINGEFVEVKKLTSGDRILIGDTILLFSEGLSISSDRNSPHFSLSDLDSNRGAPPTRVLKSVGAPSVPDFSEVFASAAEKGSPSTDKLRILYKASLANPTGHDIEEIMSRMLDIIFELLEPRFGCMMLIDGEREFEVKAQARKFQDSYEDESYEPAREILEQALEKQAGFLASRQIEVDGHFQQRQVLCTPMYGRYGRVGIIYIEGVIDRDEDEIEISDSNLVLTRGFSEDELNLTIAIGHQAGTAIEDKIFSDALIHGERMTAIGEIVAMLSHQIKNIMQGIGGGGFMIKRGLANNDPLVIEQGWNIVEKNQGKIKDLVLDMLSFSKDREPNRESVSLDSLVNDAIELVQGYAEQNQVSIQTEIPTDVFANIDIEMLQRAIHNLLLNGIDACADKKGKIVIRFDRDDQYFYLDFIDNGTGIKKENLNKIFSPFNSTKGGRGTGLGLTISRKCCREHGGDLTVSSVYGEGTEFRMALPAADQFTRVESAAELERQNDETLTRPFDFREFQEPGDKTAEDEKKRVTFPTNVKRSIPVMRFKNGTLRVG